jgi:hypothetical protein
VRISEFLVRLTTNEENPMKKRLLGPVNTNPIGSVAPEKAPIKARGEKFGHSK